MVAADPIDPAPRFSWPNHVDDRGRSFVQSQKRSGREVGDDGAFSTSKCRCEHAPVVADMWMPHGEDAAEDGMEATDGDGIRD